MEWPLNEKVVVKLQFLAQMGLCYACQEVAAARTIAADVVEVTPTFSLLPDSPSPSPFSVDSKWSTDTPFTPNEIADLEMLWGGDGWQHGWELAE